MTVSYTYNTLGLVTKEPVGEQTISYTYDKNGNPLTVSLSDSIITRTYDKHNRVLTKSETCMGKAVYIYAKTDGVPEGFRYELSTEPKGNKTKKVYDKTGRLASVYDGSSAKQYSYYFNNHMMQSAERDSCDTYTYDNNGNLLGVTGTHSRSYSYDKNNRLINSINGQVITSYTYDGNGLCTSKTTNGITTRFVNDRGNVAGEIVGENVYSYVRGNGLASYFDGTNTGIYTSNLHGDVSQIIAYGQKSLVKYGFDAFGNENSAAVICYGLSKIIDAIMPK